LYLSEFVQEEMMRYSMCALVILVLSGVTLAAAGEGKTYGKKITVRDVTPIADILANPDKYEGKQVLVEGQVGDVCKKMGCWMVLKAEGKADSIRIKVKDGEIVFPQEARGKMARAQGVVSVRTMTREQLIAQGEHMAEEQGITFDPSTVTGPKKVVQINGEGAVVSGVAKQK
jgi:hypothetical protein